MKRNLHLLRFGSLVSALRNDIEKTQEELAADTGLGVRIIRDIEQGNRLNLHKDGVLIKLAHGLQLTTLERQQFLFAASGASEQDFLRQARDIPQLNQSDDQEANEILDNLKHVLIGLRTPAYVVDSYCDIILANRLIIELLRIPPHLLAEAKNEQAVGNCNLMRVLFHPESTYQSFVGSDWERHALQNIRFFRRTSLRYRNSQYYLELSQELRKYEAFRWYWKRTLVEMNDEFLNYSVYTVSLPHGPTLEYAGVASFVGVTPFGELLMNMYLPLSDDTAQIFNVLYQKNGPGCEQFAPFPDMRKLKPRRRKSQAKD